ncbi:MAG: Hsp20/alpha crystallin family protein [Chloroflexi bacterium]|nr:Hsp20/alpha crystallin family protein [Chloroflexota bacterium]
MRYRKYSYSYSMVVPAGRTHGWQTRESAVLMSHTCWSPPTDVCETKSAVFVTVEIAGVEDDALEVVLYQNALVIEGRRKLPPVESDGVYRAAEIRQGPFRVEVSIPMPIDTERVEGRYERGLLHITLPKMD